MAVREGLLALLGSGPSYGYQLKTAFESATGGVWPLNVGQVYTTLERLQRDGLVEVEEVDAQKRYRLTADGREALAEWWDEPTVHQPPPRDELLLKVLFAIESRPDSALEVITRYRSALTRTLQERRRRVQGTHRRGRSTSAGAASNPDDPAVLAAALAADAVTVRTEADLRWLDLCEARLLERDRRGAR